MTILETTLEKKCCEYAREHGCFGLKQGNEGLEDRQFFWGNGRHFWVEFKKSETGRVRPLQAIIMKMHQNWGDKVYLVDQYNQFQHIIKDWEEKYGPATAIRPA